MTIIFMLALALVQAQALVLHIKDLKMAMLCRLIAQSTQKTAQEVVGIILKRFEVKLNQ
jgi:hypothetical protein